jgi:hypothetical protein
MTYRGCGGLYVHSRLALSGRGRDRSIARRVDRDWVYIQLDMCAGFKSQLLWGVTTGKNFQALALINGYPLYVCVCVVRRGWSCEDEISVLDFILGCLK